jgi:hypothetical protein
MLVDPWLAVIGVFVYVGAAGEERATLVHLQLAGHRVRDMMVNSPRVVECDARLRDLEVLVQHDSQRVFAVVCGGHLAGLIDVSTTRLRRISRDPSKRCRDHTTVRWPWSAVTGWWVSSASKTSSISQWLAAQGEPSVPAIGRDVRP